METLSCSWANVTPQGESYRVLRVPGKQFCCTKPVSTFTTSLTVHARCDVVVYLVSETEPRYGVAYTYALRNV